MPIPLLNLTPYLSSERVRFFTSGVTKNQVLTELASLTADHPYVHDNSGFLNAIFEREEVSSTGIGGGVAVPHAKLPSIDGIVISVGLMHEPIAFGAVDGEPVSMALMIAACDRHRQEYLRLLATVASRMKDEQVRSELLASDDPQQVVDILGG